MKKLLNKIDEGEDQFECFEYQTPIKKMYMGLFGWALGILLQRLNKTYRHNLNLNRTHRERGSLIETNLNCTRYQHRELLGTLRNLASILE